MKANLPILLACTVAIAAGFAIGRISAPTSPAPEKPSEKKAVRTPGSVPDLGAEASLRALRSRIKSLEEQLAAARKSDTAASEPAAEPVAVGKSETAAQKKEGQPWAEGMRQRMEEIKRNDPKRYEEMRKRFEDFRARSMRRTRGRLEWLASVDTSRMTAEQKETHANFQELMARREVLMQTMDIENKAISDSDRKAAFDEMRTLSRQLHQLAEAERHTLLSETAASLGYTGSDAEEIVSTVQSIYEATQAFGFGGPGGHRPPHGPRH